MFRKKTTEPSREERLAAANAQAVAALHIFDKAALDLEEAAAEKYAVQQEVEQEIQSMLAQIDALEDQSESLEVAIADDLHAADKVRSLFA